MVHHLDTPMTPNGIEQLISLRLIRGWMVAHIITYFFT